MPIAKLGAYTIHYRNGEEYHRLKQEIFTRDTYYFETSTAAPVIIDAGAHIGLASLYFKKLYPLARITAIEPLPQNLTLLEQNLWENHLDDVNIIAGALAAQAGYESLYFDASKDEWFSTASFSRGAWTGTQRSDQLSVETFPLSQFLTEKVTVLKLDIEGAEQAVLTAAGHSIRNVHHLFIEFHPVAHQSLTALLELLAEHHFKITLWKDGQEVPPSATKGLVMIEAVNQDNPR